MYNLYLDKSTEFECEISVKNANLNDSFARMIVATDNVSLLFEGKIHNNKCKIPINKLKGIFTENTIGKMKLEIVVENTYFSPWSDNFETKEHTSVKVQVQEQKEVSTKPILEVKVKTSSPSPKISLPAKELVKICEKFDINSKNYKTKKREDFKQLVNEYFKYNDEFKKKLNVILKEVVSVLK